MGSFAADPDFLERLDLLKICLSYSWGGLEQVAASDALDAASLGVRVRLLCLDGTPIHEQLARHKEVELLPLDFRPSNRFDLKMRRELNRRIAEGTNAIHAHQTSILGSVSPWVMPHPKVGLFATRHIMNNHRKRGVYHRFIYSRLDAMIVMSRALRDNVLETHAIPENLVKVVHLGLDFDRFDPLKVDCAAQRAQWGADADTVVIGLVGRIDPAKGQAAFIRAAAGLLKNQKPGEKFKFVIVGEETLGARSDYLAELRQMVDQFGLGEFVIFAGYQENIPAVMSSFDIFVMPSRQEAFGLVAIEAMAMECPIVISSGGSAEEIVGAEQPGGRREFGRVMRPGDAFDLQVQLRYLLDNPEERALMGRRARKHVVQNYDRKNRIRDTFAIYEQAMRKRGL
ncbi:MAG: glycosyltransferase family 4 protein [Oligoflexia bacterium]|nr:glycosyltransferase family 4 protein [Oligoflexia bacterium]